MVRENKKSVSMFITRAEDTSHYLDQLIERIPVELRPMELGDDVAD